jgi:hypothetical protein
MLLDVTSSTILVVSFFRVIAANGKDHSDHMKRRWLQQKVKEDTSMTVKSAIPGRDDKWSTLPFIPDVNACDEVIG